MVQKDYVKQRRKRPHKNIYTSKKESNQGLSKITFTVTIAIIIIFIASLYFFKQSGRTSILRKTVLPNSNQLTKNLPPRPEERWRYTKELEKHSSADVANFNYSVKLNINNSAELSNEKHQLLEQIDISKCNSSINLSKISNNDNTPCSYMSINTLPIKLPLQLKNVLQQTQEKTNNQQKIVLQCGSFKNLKRAESVRANLAFSGLESKINSTEGWNRVVLGPYNQETAEKVYDQVKSISRSNCILRTSKG